MYDPQLQIWKDVHNIVNGKKQATKYGVVLFYFYFEKKKKNAINKVKRQMTNHKKICNTNKKGQIPLLYKELLYFNKKTHLKDT